MDVGQQLLVRDGLETHLTTREVELLVYLASNPRRTLTREELLEKVWGHSPLASTEPVYSSIKRLRAKVDQGSAHRHIVTVHGDGYRFEPAPAKTVNTTHKTPVPPPGPPSGAAPRVHPSTAPRAARTRFVGRDAERRALNDALAAGARLVTLVGPGGVGKTRLALELAAELRASGRRVAFVDLAETQSRAEVAHAVAQSFDLPLEGSGHGLGAALADGGLELLVLDNAEQVAPELAELANTWLDSLRLLVTSRERLALSGEQVVELGPLPEADAVALYLDRARLASATFEADAETLEQIRQIVDRLDGLPLAIELIAARFKTMPPSALMARLEHGQLDLGLAPRDRPLRHKTLRAAIEWSWRLLTPREQELLAHSSVFAGGITLEAARAVLGDDAPALLESLCDRSLMRVTDDAPLRFEPWVAVHELAAEHLTRSPDAAVVGLRHAAWAIEEGQRWIEDLDGRGHARARRRLEAELDNLRRAFGRSRAIGSPDILPLARLLAQVLMARGAFEETATLLEAALSAPGGASSTARTSPAPLADHPTLLLLLGECRQTQGLDGLPELERAMAAAKARGEADLEALAQAQLGLGYASRGELDRALALLHSARDTALAAGHRAIEGRVRTALGEVCWRAGRVSEAEPELTLAHTIHEELGDLRLSARTAATLCHVMRASGRALQADLHLEHALSRFEALEDPLGVARTLVDRGLHLSRLGRQREAVAALEEAERRFVSLGVVRGREEVHLNLAEALLGLGEDERARKEIGRAVTACRELGERLRLSVALELAGCAAILNGELAHAEAAFDEALAMAQATRNRISEATLLAKRGLVRYLGSRWAAALDDFRASERLHAERGASAMEGTSTADVAVLLAAQGEADAARAACARARELLRDPPITHWTGRMLALLDAASLVFGAPLSAAAEALASARATRAQVLAAMPEDSQDLATRLSLLMLDHALAQRAS